jgi:hypothetical protein
MTTGRAQRHFTADGRFWWAARGTVLFLLVALLACEPLAALLATPTPQPSSPAAGRTQLSQKQIEDRLSRMILTRADLPPMVVAVAEGYQSNAAILEEFADLPEAAQLLAASGRVNGYVVLYQPLTELTAAPFRALLLSVELYTSPSLAAQALERTAMRPDVMSQMVAPIGEQTIAYRAPGDGGGELTTVAFRVGALTSYLTLSSRGGESPMPLAEELARKVYDRIEQALRAAN